VRQSGTGELTVDSRGMSSTDIVYDDMNTEQIQSLPDDAVHRFVDSFIDKEGEKGNMIGTLSTLRMRDLHGESGYVNTYIVLPSTVWGVATGKLADAGVVNKLSIQVPLLVAASIGRGQGGMPGKGLNVWPHVEVHERMFQQRFQQRFVDS
jgi:hypothetical protein